MDGVVSFLVTLSGCGDAMKSSNSLLSLMGVFVLGFGIGVTGGEAYKELVKKLDFQTLIIFNYPYLFSE